MIGKVGKIEICEASGSACSDIDVSGAPANEQLSYKFINVCLYLHTIGLIVLVFVTSNV